MPEGPITSPAPSPRWMQRAKVVRAPFDGGSGEIVIDLGNRAEGPPV